MATGGFSPRRLARMHDSLLRHVGSGRLPGLVALISRRGAELWAAAPATLKDLMEVRGIGIVRVPALAEAPVALVVDLVAAPDIERCPEPERETLLGVALPKLRLHAPDASAPAKLRLAMRLSNGSGERR